MFNLYWLEEPVAKAGTTADAVRLHVLGSFKGFFGCKTNLASHEIIERVVGIYACGVGVEAATIDFDGDVEAQHFFPFRILSVFFGFVGISGIRANALADELIGGVAIKIILARNESLFALRTFHDTDRKIELRQEIGGTRVLRGLSRDEIWTIGNEIGPLHVVFVGFSEVDVEIEVSFQAHAVLVVRRHGIVHGRFVERWEQTLVEQFARTIAHHPVCPGVAIGVFKELRRQFGTLLPRGGIGKGCCLDGRWIHSAFLQGIFARGVIGPFTPTVHHVIRLTLVVHIADGEENLVFVGMIEDVIIHELAFFVEEVEAKSPAFQFSADDADVVGALFAVNRFQISHRGGALHLNSGPLCGVVANDGKLFLLPRCVAIDKVAVHLTVTVGVSFLEHRQTSGPVVEGSIGIGVRHRIVRLDFGQTVDIVVGSGVSNGLSFERIVIIVDVDVAKDKVVARSGETSDCQQTGGNGG